MHVPFIRGFGFGFSYFITVPPTAEEPKNVHITVQRRRTNEWSDPSPGRRDHLHSSSNAVSLWQSELLTCVLLEIRSGSQMDNEPDAMNSVTLTHNLDHLPWGF